MKTINHKEKLDHWICRQLGIPCTDLSLIDLEKIYVQLYYPTHINIISQEGKDLVISALSPENNLVYRIRVGPYAITTKYASNSALYVNSEKLIKNDYELIIFKLRQLKDDENTSNS